MGFTEMPHDVPLRDRCRGRWLGILVALGVPRHHLTGKNTACPFCRQGKDRFRFTDLNGDGRWICSRCGNGDGADLLMRYEGIEFSAAATRIEGVIGNANVIIPQADIDEDKRRAMLTELWASGGPIIEGSPADIYLSARLGFYPRPGNVRAVDSLAGPGGVVYPGFIARIQHPGGGAATIHRTFLTVDGQKAPIDQPRKLMPGRGKFVPGCAVRLYPEAETMGVGEGIETCIAARIIYSMPVWAALDASHLEAWEPPEIAKHIVVLGDNDSSYTGQAAAYALAKRLRQRDLRVTVAIPPTPGSDWNDEHLSRLRINAAAGRMATAATRDGGGEGAVSSA